MTLSHFIIIYFLCIGLESDVYPNQFVVIDQNTPCYTEPFWRNIGLRVYPQASLSILVIIFVVGLTAVSLRFVLNASCVLRSNY